MRHRVQEFLQDGRLHGRPMRVHSCSRTTDRAVRPREGNIPQPSVGQKAELQIQRRFIHLPERCGGCLQPRWKGAGKSRHRRLSGHRFRHQGQPPESRAGTDGRREFALYLGSDSRRNAFLGLLRPPAQPHGGGCNPRSRLRSGRRGLFQGDSLQYQG